MCAHTHRIAVISCKSMVKDIIDNVLHIYALGSFYFNAIFISQTYGRTGVLNLASQIWDFPLVLLLIKRELECVYCTCMCMPWFCLLPWLYYLRRATVRWSEKMWIKRSRANMTNSDPLKKEILKKRKEIYQSPNNSKSSSGRKVLLRICWPHSFQERPENSRSWVGRKTFFLSFGAPIRSICKLRTIII